jgi:hypothetical protein
MLNTGAGGWPLKIEFVEALPEVEVVPAPQPERKTMTIVVAMTLIDNIEFALLGDESNNRCMDIITS